MECNYIETDADISTIVDMSPDEICEGNIAKINSICEALNTFKVLTMGEMRTYKIFDILTGEPMYVSGAELYRLLLQCKHVEMIQERMQDDFPKAQLIHALQHPYIDDPQLFMRQLNGLATTLFRDLTVIMVNAKKDIL